MHFEILVEDQSGKKMLDTLIPKIIGDQHTFKVIDYRGTGHIPRNLASSTDVRNRLLLDQLPSTLSGKLCFCVRIKSFEFLSCVIESKLPVDTHLFSISCFDPSVDLSL